MSPALLEPLMYKIAAPWILCAAAALRSSRARCASPELQLLRQLKTAVPFSWLGCTAAQQRLTRTRVLVSADGRLHIFDIVILIVTVQQEKKCGG